MTDRPLITMTLIARDEKLNVKRCFDSWWDAVDEVVLVDTGSNDGTVSEARRYAQRRKQPDKLITGRFKWCDDFAAARQVADELANGQWLCWCDLDDTIEGMDKLRQMAADASDDVAAFFLHYSYARDQHGNTISELWRERLVRNDGTEWTGRLHEHKLITKGAVVQVDPRVADWVHWRNHENRTGERNLRVLEAWLEDEPDNARVIQSIAMEYMGGERHAEAADMFARYLSMPGEEPDRRAQATRHMCVQLMLMNRPMDARNAALQAAAENWMWPDTHLTLAESAHTLGRPQEGVVHAQTALEIGKPNTLLIVNPQQYTAQPLAVMAVCLTQLGRLDEAHAKLEECLAIAPSYPLAAQQLPLVQSLLRKHRAVASVVANMDVLVEAGELEKARRLLDQAPWYVFDDERLVQRRGQLSSAIRKRLKDPPELHGDEQADALIAELREAA